MKRRVGKLGIVRGWEKRGDSMTRSSRFRVDRDDQSGVLAGVFIWSLLLREHAVKPSSKQYVEFQEYCIVVNFVQADASNEIWWAQTMP